jgi:hypothetical protein
MKVYELSWGSFVENLTYIYSHKDNPTKEQFKKDCSKALREVGEEYVDKTESFVGMQEWVEGASKKLKEYGYVLLWPNENVIYTSFWGMSNVGFGEKRDEELFRSFVGDRLYKKAVKKNEEVVVEFDKKLRKNLAEHMRKRRAKELLPGSEFALQQGCTCPVLDNEYGRGYMGVEGHYCFNIDCPIHGEVK